MQFQPPTGQPRDEQWQSGPQEQWQQPQYPPGPETYYAPSQPLQPQQQPFHQQYQQVYQPQIIIQPPKKSRMGRIFGIGCGSLVLLFVLIAIIGVAGSHGSSTATPTAQSTTSTDQSTQAPVTPTPAHTAKWTTTQKFSGNGEKTTATFTTHGDWKIIWTAQADSASEAFFGLSVYSAGDGSLVDSGADATIPAGKQGTDSTEEHTGAGSFYLKVYAGIPWTIQVQELK